jgi:hypothetical protein
LLLLAGLSVLPWLFCASAGTQRKAAAAATQTTDSANRNIRRSRAVIIAQKNMASDNFINAMRGNY